MKNQKEKPQYNIVQNFCFLTNKAWCLEKGCAVYPIAQEGFLLMTQLAELFITPMILAKIESKATLWELLGTIVFFTLFLTVFTAAYGYCNLQNGRVEGRLRLYLFHLINKKECMTSYENVLKKEYQEDMGVKTYNDGSGLYENVWAFFGAVAGFIIYLCLLTAKLPCFLVALSVGIAVVGYFLNIWVNRWRYARDEEVKGYGNYLNYVSNTIMNNQMSKDIRVFGLSGWLRAVYESAFALYQGYVRRREWRYMVVELVNVLLSLLRNAIAYAYLIGLVLQEELSVAEFVLLFGAVSGFTQWVTNILNRMAKIHEESLNLCRMRKILEYPEPFLFEEGKGIPKEDAYTITLEEVTYQYEGAEEPTIKELNLTVHSGEKIAIVGLNGAGKTTLVKLLCGFVDPTEGRVLLNGQDIRQYNRRQYYGLFSAVFQDFSALDSTMAGNVAQTEENIDYTKVADCLEKAGLTETMAALPRGVETFLGKWIDEEGVDLSGGQLQRLMLARALYKDAPVLVLDEPTAALDPLAESDIYEKYNAMSAGKSSVFISHRLASTRFCDRVLFLEKGRITEEGTHESLLAKGQGYAHLFEVQARYYREAKMDFEEIGGEQSWQK